MKEDGQRATCGVHDREGIGPVKLPDISSVLYKECVYRHCNQSMSMGDIDPAGHGFAEGQCDRDANRLPSMDESWKLVSDELSVEREELDILSCPVLVDKETRRIDGPLS